MTAITEKAVPVASPMQNAVVGFSEMIDHLDGGCRILSRRLRGLAKRMEVRAGKLVPPSSADVGFKAQHALYAVTRTWHMLNEVS